MARIHKTSDKIKVKIDDIWVKISPLSFEQKCELQSQLISGQPMDIVRAAKTALKYSVKEIGGVEDYEGNPYELSFENGELSEECIDDLLNLEQNEKLSILCTTLLHGVPKELIDPNTGKKMEGVTIDKGPARKKK